MTRSAIIGFASSSISDVCSNTFRVIKTNRQTSAENISCIPGFAIPDRILAKDGGGIKGFCEAFANHYINIFDGIPLSGLR